MPQEYTIGDVTGGAVYAHPVGKPKSNWEYVGAEQKWIRVGDLTAAVEKAREEEVDKIVAYLRKVANDMEPSDECYLVKDLATNISEGAHWYRSASTPPTEG